VKPKYKQFVFEYYRFDAIAKTLELHYGFDGSLHFTESYRFVFGFAEFDPAKIDRACQNLFFMAGVSYYKAYLAPKITINKGVLDKLSAAFFSKTYQRGLGEFFYSNRLDPRTPVEFPTNTATIDDIAMDR